MKCALRYAVCLALAFAPCTLSAQTGVSAVTFNGGNFDIASNGTAGYAFSLNTPVLVTDLGMYDFLGDGFSVSSHAVGIWDSSGVLLASVTVSSTSVLADSFRYAALGAPLLLVPGQTYIVGAAIGSEIYQFNTTNTVFNPAINYLGNRSNNNGSALAFPNLYIASDDVGIFGGSFRLLPVPEPSAFALLSVAALLAAAGKMSARKL
jgi:hypothetical protein